MLTYGEPAVTMSPLLEPVTPVKESGAGRRLARACSFLSPRAERLLRSVRLQQTALRVRASLTELCRGASLTDVSTLSAASAAPASVSTRSCPEPGSPPSATTTAFLSMWRERDRQRSLARVWSCEALPRCRLSAAPSRACAAQTLPRGGQTAGLSGDAGTLPRCRLSAAKCDAKTTPQPAGTAAGRVVRRSRVHRRVSPPTWDSRAVAGDGAAADGCGARPRRRPHGRCPQGGEPSAAVQRRHSCHVTAGGRAHIHSWARRADAASQVSRRADDVLLSGRRALICDAHAMSDLEQIGTAGTPLRTKTGCIMISCSEKPHGGDEAPYTSRGVFSMACWEY